MKVKNLHLSYRYYVSRHHYLPNFVLDESQLSQFDKEIFQ